MGKVVNSIAKVSSFGLIDDFTGQEAAADAAMRAGDVQAAAALRKEEGINRRFDENQATLKPQIDAGNKAREQQLALLGLNGTGAQSAAMNSIAESPAQKWLRDRAQKNLLQNAAAIGGVGGGDVRSALVEQGAGFAMQDMDNQFNRLAGVAGQGNNANSTSVQAGANAANNAGNAIMQGGQAQAGGIMGVAQANAAGTNQAFQLAGLAGAAFTGGASIPAAGAMSGGGAPGFGVNLQ